MQTSRCYRWEISACAEVTEVTSRCQVCTGTTVATRAVIFPAEERPAHGAAAIARLRSCQEPAHTVAQVKPVGVNGLSAVLQEEELLLSEGDGEAGKLGREEPDEVQQRQMQGPAPGEEQPQAPVQAGADLLESSSAERDWECWGTTG